MAEENAANPPKFLSVGQVARRSGVAVSTLHFYEAKGLITSLRTAGNQRRYARDILRRIAIIKVAQDLGFPLAEILELLKPVPSGQMAGTDEVSAMVDRWQQAIQARIDGLTELRDKMEGCIGCGCLSKTDCPLRNPDDRLGRTASGPLLLQTARR
ncbi:redox-sensitive transcriptional activator SoxR [Mangrovicoccus ximenensis]|uniref:redox-sensitive transcriptional activator SoxR n=1 Tax=Mangrovicoccus ximenensis TaxID=1911570 RepID=UPI000D39EE79|nr:redox-sensitive transcriptional activator SoxR [Mangrovicoccus ximenensis]